MELNQEEVVKGMMENIMPEDTSHKERLAYLGGHYSQQEIAMLVLGYCLEVGYGAESIVNPTEKSVDNVVYLNQYRK